MYCDCVHHLFAILAKHSDSIRERSLVFSLTVPAVIWCPERSKTWYENPGLAQGVSAVVFPEHWVQDFEFWCETSWLKGTHWLIPKPTAVPVKPQRALCASGAGFGAIPLHNACLYLSTVSRNRSLSFSQWRGWTRSIHRCIMAVCLYWSSISSH